MIVTDDDRQYWVNGTTDEDMEEIVAAVHDLIDEYGSINVSEALRLINGGRA